MPYLPGSLLSPGEQTVQAEKWSFHVSSVYFLGLITQDGSVKADPEKISVVVEWLIQKV